MDHMYENLTDSYVDTLIKGRLQYLFTPKNGHILETEIQIFV